MLYSQLPTQQIKEIITQRKQDDAEQANRTSSLEKKFVNSIKDDLELLKGEGFQRHDPEYYDEVEYYNNFHKLIPNSLVLTNSYRSFIKVYREDGGSLYDAVLAFLKAYELDNLEGEDFTPIVIEPHDEGDVV